jgi:hypothetical protein
MKTQMPFNNEIEKTKKDIEVLTAKLALLEEIENHKTPCEEAFKRVYNRYPVTDVNDTCWDGSTWIDFKFGYIASQEDYKVGEYQPTMTRITRVEVITDTGRDYVNWEGRQRHYRIIPRWWEDTQSVCK